MAKSSKYGPKIANKKPILSNDEAIEILEYRLQKAEEQVEAFENLFRGQISNHRKDAFLYRAAIQAIKFKQCFDDFYGIGLEVANLHSNGDLEPFDNLYNSACC